jgi:hypothetical protein
MFWKSRTSMRRMKEAMGAEGELVHVRYGCDEVNNSLMRHPLGIEFLIDFALMGRKENFGLAMASNSLWKFMQIPGASDLIDAMATLTYFNDPAATGKNRPLYESHELPERAIGWVTELADREYVKFQPEAKVCRRLTRALDKDIMAVIGTSRTVRIVDEYIDRYPVAKYGDGFWQKMMLRAQGADEAADTLEGILAQSEDAKLVVAS